MYKQLNMTAKKFYHEIYEISKQHDEYCPYFKSHEKGLIMFLYTTCIILQKHPLVKSANLAPSIIPQIEKQAGRLITLFASLHNHFVRKGKNSTQAKKFLSQITKQASYSILNITILCDQLICTSNFINEDFIYIASCIQNIQFSIKKIRHKLKKNVLFYKDTSHKNPLNITTSIKGKLPINIDLQTLRTNIAIHNYIELLTNNQNKTNEIYQKFLLEKLEKKYHCSFYKLLLCLANAALKNSRGEPFIKGTQVFLCNGQPIVFNQLSIVAGSEINQEDNCIVSPSSTVTQQSYNQATNYIPIKQ
ncbi:hypothetical protein K6025_05010 [Ehrlichia sp. JZT12]